MNTNLLTVIAAFAAQNPDGFTFNIKTMEPQKSGFAVARVETQDSFGSEGLQRVLDFCTEHPDVECVGGWYNKKNGQYYFDATMIIQNRAAAIMLGRANKQLAIYDLNIGAQIDL